MTKHNVYLGLNIIILSQSFYYHYYYYSFATSFVFKGFIIALLIAYKILCLCCLVFFYTIFG